MANYLFCLFVQNVVLPIILFGCKLSIFSQCNLKTLLFDLGIALRPTGFSLVYFGFLCLLPYVPVVQKKSLKGTSDSFHRLTSITFSTFPSSGITGVYFHILIWCCTIIVLSQVMIQIAWLLKDNWNISDDEFPKLLRYIGFVPLRGFKYVIKLVLNSISFYSFHERFIEICRWVMPDVFAFISSIAFFTSLKKISRGRKPEQEYLKSISIEPAEEKTDPNKAGHKNDSSIFQHYESLKAFKIGKFASIIALCFAGIVEPSASNGVYFLSFLSLSTCLACNRKLHKKFAILLMMNSILVILHLSAIILYQTPWMQDQFDENSWICRISGLIKIFTYTGKMQDQMNFNSQLDWDHYMNPIILIVTYSIITSTALFILVNFL